MNIVSDIEAETFEEKVKAVDGLAVIEFWIRSCSQCKKFKPVYEKLPGIFGESVRFLRMNMFKSIENLRLAEGLEVEETPTVKIFCKGKEDREIVGYIPLDDAIEEVKTRLRSCN